MSEVISCLNNLEWRTLEEKELYTSFESESGEQKILVVDLSSIKIEVREQLQNVHSLLHEFFNNQENVFLTNGYLWDIYIEGKYYAELTVPPTPERLLVMKQLQCVHADAC